MNRTHVIHFAWKDYRRLRGFWFALVFIWLIGLGVLASSALGPPLSSDVLCGALFVTAFYAIGWAGLTFAGEHEENTYAYLRSLPVVARSVFFGKLLFGVLSTLMLCAVLLLVTWLPWPISIRGADPWDDAMIAQSVLAGLAIPMAIAAGMYWSLRSKYPLRAIGLGAFSTLLFLYGGVAAAVVGTVVEGDTVSLSEMHMGWIVAVVSAVTVCFLVADLRRVEVWLPTAPREPRRAWRPERKVLAPELARAPRRMAPRRLLWLAWRQQRHSWWLPVLGITFGVIGALIGGPFPVLALLSVAWLGIATVRSEHYRDRYLFLGQLGARPLPYWVACTMLSWLVAVIISLLVSWGMGRMLLTVSNDPALWVVQPLVFVGGLTTFAIAQFASLACSSVILAAGFTAALCSLHFFWLTVCYATGTPLWWSVAPCALLPFVGTYLRIPRWFRGAEGWRAWVIPCLPLVFMFVGIPLVTAGYRVWEIPRVDLEHAGQPLSWMRESSESAKETGEAYQKLSSKIVAKDAGVPQEYYETFVMSTDDFYIWPEDDELVEALMALANRAECVFPPRMADDTYRVAALLLADASRKMFAGDSDLAWARYQAVLRFARQRNDGDSAEYGALLGAAVERAVYRILPVWAMQDNTTVESIEAAVDWIDQFRQQQPAWTEVIRGGYRLTTEAIEKGHPESTTFEYLTQTRLRWLRSFAPWEVERARRLRDVIAVESTARLVELQTFPLGLPDRHKPELTAYGFGGSRSYQARLQTINRWREQTLLPIYLSGYDTFAHNAGDIENQRRGVMYQLASIAHHREHGAYPETFRPSVEAPATFIQSKLPSSYYGQMSMEHVNDEEGHRHHFIVSMRDALIDGSATSFGPLRVFLLPDFERWDHHRYLHQYDHGDFVRPGDHAEMSLDDTPELSRFLPEAGDRSFDVAPILGVLGPQSLHDVAIATIRQTLESGSEGDKLRLIEVIGSERVALEHFADDLIKRLEDESSRVAAFVSRTLRTAIEEDRLALREHKHLILARFDRSTRQFGLPIRNPQNGHYYQVVEAEASIGSTWEEVSQAVSHWQYRGLTGYLATITSAEESQFLEQAFAAAEEPYWIGGSDAEEPGTWKWVGGPEKGQVFWKRAGTKEALGFHRWIGSEPRETGNYLLWNWPLDDEAGGWRNAENQPYDWPAVLGYLVEYSGDSE